MPENLIPIFLGIIQGVTEFLPVSSSGHVALVAEFLGLTPTLSLQIFLNTATFISVLLVFNTSLIPLIKKYWLHVLVGSLPAGIIGVLFKDNVDQLVNEVSYLPFFFLISAIFLISTKFVKRSVTKPLSLSLAFAIGVAQAVALLPGVSRSGSTITTALLLGLEPATAFIYSFLLFLPASFGALLLELKDGFSLGLNLSWLISFALTLIVGIISLNYLKKLLQNGKIYYFGYYLLALSIILFGYFYL